MSYATDMDKSRLLQIMEGSHLLLEAGSCRPLTVGSHPLFEQVAVDHLLYSGQPAVIWAGQPSTIYSGWPFIVRAGQPLHDHSRQPSVVQAGQLSLIERQRQLIITGGHKHVAADIMAPNILSLWASLRHLLLHYTIGMHLIKILQWFRTPSC